MDPESYPENPFASPIAAEDPNYVPPNDFEAERRHYLKHEASVKSIGTLFLLGFVFSLLATVIYIFMLVSGETGPDEMPFVIGFMLMFAVFTALYFWVGNGLRRLDPRVRIPAIVMSAIGLLNIPIGTLINLYFLYLLCSEKGQRVLSPDYQAIVAATPHIKYKTSIVVWIFLGLLILLLGFMIVGIVMAG